jgi:hypothetical protein
MTIFTAKWEYEINGIQCERLIEADQVSVAYDSRTPDIKNQKGAPSPRLGIYNVPINGIIVLGNPESGSDSMALTFGTIYIMNRDGRTVGKYYLAKDPPWEVNTDAADHTVVGMAQPETQDGSKA